MEINNFFQLAPIPPNAMTGTYTLSLVILSYFIATIASYVALDITERIRSFDETDGSKTLWLFAGAFAMGMGIWTMHFIGMLAFVMPMPMEYDSKRTLLSLILAVIASGFAFYLIKNEKVKLIRLILGGFLLGLGIVTMHYIGMSAMENVHITYQPGLFFTSIAIAILASEVALWLMISGSNLNIRFHQLLKIGSSLVMGLAICGMHYTGMAAAVFVNPVNDEPLNAINNPQINPNILSFFIATTTLIIMSIALVASKTWMNSLQSKNFKLVIAEKELEQKSIQLEKLNQNLKQLMDKSIEREEWISAILTAAADGIFVINELGVIELCNRAASEILGYDTDEIIFSNIEDFLSAEAANEKNQDRFSLSYILKHENVLLETHGYKKDKTKIPIEISVSRSLYRDQKIYIIIIRDISERKHAEEKLTMLHNQLISTARLAGMAEVASCVLHNVGNVLNSINVTAQILLARDSQSKVDGLHKLAVKLEEHKKDLGNFITGNPLGKLLPEYMKEFADYWNNEQIFIHRELESLNSKVQHIKNIVAMQQSLSCNSTMVESIQIDNILDDAIAINSEYIEKYGIQLVRDYAKIPPFDLDKVKTLQTLVNLTKNAIESLVESNKKEKKLIIKTMVQGSDKILIEIIDNGIGIPQENISKIFNYGFTTKKKGHGFGLHACALSAQEVGGSLKAYSHGLNQGARFVLTLPKKAEEFNESFYAQTKKGNV